jgi:hypothetical protein
MPAESVVGAERGKGEAGVEEGEEGGEEWSCGGREGGR